MYWFAICSVCFAINFREIYSVKEVVEWSHEEDVSVLGLFKNYTEDRDNLNQYLQVVNHLIEQGCVISFGVTDVEEAWDLYAVDYDDTYVMIALVNYDEHDRDWSGRNKVINYQGVWNPLHMSVWLTTYTYPPVIDLNQMILVGGTTAEHGNFLLS